MQIVKKMRDIVFKTAITIIFVLLVTKHIEMKKIFLRI